jgi:hypothetical protein
LVCGWLVLLTALQGWWPSPVAAQSTFDGYTRVAVPGLWSDRATRGGLRPLAVHAVNNRGDIVGETEVRFDSPTSFHYVVAVIGAGGATFPFGTAAPSRAVALNDRGMVVGVATSGPMTTLIREPAGTVITMSGQLGVALNNHGDVLLQAYQQDPAGVLPRASIRHLDGTVSDLTALNAVFLRFVVSDLNDHGDVVGFIESQPSGAGGPVVADLFLLRAGAAAPEILTRFATRSQAYLNNDRQVVVHEALSGGTRAWLWASGQLLELAPGAVTSRVQDFNDRGEVILAPYSPDGWILYRAGQRTPLLPLQEPPSSYIDPSEFLGITDSGNIVGRYLYCLHEPPPPGSGLEFCAHHYFRADPPLQSWGLGKVVAGNHVTLHWQAPTPVSAATNYVVEAGTTPGGAELGGVLTHSTTTTFTATAPAAEYHVRVRAVSGTNVGPASNDVVVRVPGCDTPEPPRLLRAAVFRNTVDLTWPPVPGAASYVVTARWGDQVLSFDTQSPATSTHRTAPDGNYWVDLRARNACGTSAPSPPTQAIVACLPPTAPQLSASVIGATVTLDWQQSASVATTYVLDVGSVPGATDVASFQTETASLSGNPPVGTYYVRVRAETVCGTGPPSNEVVVSVGAP